MDLDTTARRLSTGAFLLILLCYMVASCSSNWVHAVRQSHGGDAELDIGVYTFCVNFTSPDAGSNDTYFACTAPDGALSCKYNLHGDRQTYEFSHCYLLLLSRLLVACALACGALLLSMTFYKGHRAWARLCFVAALHETYSPSLQLYLPYVPEPHHWVQLVRVALGAALCALLSIVLFWQFVVRNRAGDYIRYAWALWAMILGLGINIAGLVILGAGWWNANRERGEYQSL